MKFSADMFELNRPRLMKLAYRLLGTMTEAEDVVQEAYLRWCRANCDMVETPAAFLTVIVQRLCADHRRTVHARREAGDDALRTVPAQAGSHVAEQQVEIAEAISQAFQVALETLSPVDRAAYLLRRVFDYDYLEIADILGKSEVHCRQLVSRAESQIRAGRPRFEPSASDADRITREMLHTCATGDLDGLIDHLASDAADYMNVGGRSMQAASRLGRLPGLRWPNASGNGQVNEEQADRFVHEWAGALNARDHRAILGLYSKDVEVASPFVVNLWGEPSGVLKGKARVGGFLRLGLAAIPDLHFDPRAVLTHHGCVAVEGEIGSEAARSAGVDTIRMRSVFHFDQAGMVRGIVADYGT